MKRSLLALIVGAFLTVVFSYLWIMSCRADLSAYFHFKSPPIKTDDVGHCIGCRLEEGSVTLYKGETIFTSPSNIKYFTYYYFPSGSLERSELLPLPTWYQLVFGKFEVVKKDAFRASHVTFPFWFILALLLLLTFFVFKRWKKIETKLMMNHFHKEDLDSSF